MKKILFLLLLFVFAISYANAAGSLVMVRADDDEEFLSSPEKMKFKNLDASFDKNKDTIIIIHGWLNDYKEAKRVCKEVIKPAREVFGNSNYVGFHWPSLDAWFGSAVRHADKAGKYLVHTLIHISKLYNNNGHKIHIFCHSLGARVTLDALTRSGIEEAALGKVCFTGAAVANDSFSKSFSGANKKGQEMNYIYFSKKDDVLSKLYALYEELFNVVLTDTEKEYTKEEWLDSLERSNVKQALKEFVQWDFQKQLDYLQKIDTQMEERAVPETELDIILTEALERSKKDAMGLTGSTLYGVGTKIANKDYHHDVDEHSDYWNSKIVIRICSDMKKTPTEDEEKKSSRRSHSCGCIGIIFPLLVATVFVCKKINKR